MKPTVLFVAPVATIKGGAEIVLLDAVQNPAITPKVVVPAAGELATRLHTLGIETAVVDFGRVNTIRRPFRFSDGLGAIKDAVAAAWKIRRLSQELCCDVIHSNGLKAHVLSALARLIGAKPLVVHMHDVPFTRQEKWVWRALAAISNRLIVVSSAVWPFQTQPPHVVTVANGIDTSRLPPLPSPATPPDVTLGFVGRLIPAKGLELLFEWIVAARSRGHAVTLSIRGEGDPAYEQELLAKVSALGLDDVISFEGKRTGIDAIYAGIDILVVPSITPEAFGMVALESMLLGIPVIAYPLGGLLDIVDEGNTGFFAADVDAFLKALEALRSPARYRAIQTAAQASVHHKFSRDAFHTNLNRVYDGLIRRRAQTHRAPSRPSPYPHPD